MISVEHEEREQHTGLWNEILVQLEKQKGKVSVDQAIKVSQKKLFIFHIFLNSSVKKYKN